MGAAAGSVELGDVLRYTGIRNRSGPQRACSAPAGAIYCQQMSMPDVQYVR